MSLTPFSRSALLQLKVQREEAGRLSQVQTHIRTIYTQVVQIAARTASTSHKYPIGPPDAFIIANLGEILAGLQALFPDCIVEYAILTKGQDGQLYDVSKMDKQVLPFVGLKASAPYIVIDWT
jgi:hypothetical protein